ncbi:hypothetical protein RFI_10078, partial [Reticulomyxa filosa]
MASPTTEEFSSAADVQPSIVSANADTEVKKEESAQKKTETEAAAVVYCYTDTDKPLTEEHLQLLRQLKEYVDNVINHRDKYEWKYDRNENMLFELHKKNDKKEESIEQICLKKWLDHIQKVDENIFSATDEHRNPSIPDP